MLTVIIQADLSNFTSTAQSSTALQILKTASNLDSKLNSTDQLLMNLYQATKDNQLAERYTVGLWNYCAMDSNGTTTCSSPQASFWFNPVEVWHLNSSQAEIPNDLKSALNTYQAVSKWMFFAYTVAVIATVAELVVGAFAICSRWGSCVTSIVSAVCLVTSQSKISQLLANRCIDCVWFHHCCFGHRDRAFHGADGCCKYRFQTLWHSWFSGRFHVRNHMACCYLLVWSRAVLAV
jgi:SUR7/PalI family